MSFLLSPAGITQAFADARYVEVAGDTMTVDLLTTAVQGRSGEALAINRQDGTAWGTTAGGPACSPSGKVPARWGRSRGGCPSAALPFPAICGC